MINIPEITIYSALEALPTPSVPISDSLNGDFSFVWRHSRLQYESYVETGM